MLGALRIALAGGLFLSAAPAAADNLSDCSSAKADIRIRACTEIIKFPRYHGRRIAPGDIALAYSNRGAAFADEGDHERAISDYDRAVRLNPKHVDAFINRGIAYGKNGDHDRAIADFHKAIELTPEYANVYYNRGVAHDKNGDHDRAIADFDNAIKLYPKYANAYYNRGVAYGKNGDHDRAIADFDNAIKLNPTDASAYYMRGIAYSDRGYHDRAVADYGTAIKLNPGYAIAYFHRGVAYEDKGTRGLAIAEYDKAIELNPDHGYAYCKRAIAYGDQASSQTNTLSMRRRFLEQARADWRSAVAKIPGGDKWHDVAKARLGHIESRLASLGDPAGSVALSPAPVPKSEPSSASNPNWSDRTVCILASDAEKLSVGASPEVQEFSRRGLSVEKCRVTLGLPATSALPKPAPSSAPSIDGSDRTVCIMASDTGKLSVGASWRAEIQEFSLRTDLPPAATRQVLKRSRSRSVEKMAGDSWTSRSVKTLPGDSSTSRRSWNSFRCRYGLSRPRELNVAQRPYGAPRPSRNSMNCKL